MPGAFTGANPKGKPGLIEVANGGTLFLDEIGEMPLFLQPKLLRVLQQKEIVRVGGVRPVQVDIRVIAATNKNLQELVEKERFRRDLFYRLNVVPISIPPLRERREDILPLMSHYLQHLGERYGQTRSLSAAALDTLLAYSWPGNVRELINVLERLVITAQGELILPRDLPSELVAGVQDLGGHLRQQVGSYELRILQEAVAHYGSLGKAAAALGIHKSTLLRKLQRIAPPAQ
jgi:transcriptional regulator with PAS, ATPase and Fis domain